MPAGQSAGGQWTSEGGSGSSGEPETDGGATPPGHSGKGPRYAALDTGTRNDATPTPPGVQYAAGNEEEENEIRGAGRQFEGTPGQQARHAIAEAEWRSVFAQILRYDPTWRPSTSSWTDQDSIEGDIARLEAATKEAEEYLARLRDLAKPRDRNTQEPISPSIDKTGDPFVDSTTEKLNDILDRIVARIGPRPDLTPGQYGTLIHEEFKKEVRAAGLPGIDAEDVDKTFGVERGASYGAKDSVRPDVVLRDDDGNIVAMYDVKTGDGFRRYQVIRYRQRTGTDSFVPLFELHPRGRTIWRRRIDWRP